jgi:hypothetical protein
VREREKRELGGKERMVMSERDEQRKRKREKKNIE